MEKEKAQRQQLDQVTSGQVKTLEERVRFLEQEKSEALQVWETFHCQCSDFPPHRCLEWKAGLLGQRVS